MLRFAEEPDLIFTDILQNALDNMIFELTIILKKSKPEDKQEEYSIFMPTSCTVFGLEVAIKTLTELLDYLLKPEIYDLTDYHYLLLYESLDMFCCSFNEYLQYETDELERKRLRTLGGHVVERLEFTAIVELYFYDEDFLYLGEDLDSIAPELKKQIGFSDEVFGISHKLAPHPEELELKVNDEPMSARSCDLYFKGDSEAYPDYNCIDTGER